MLKREACVTGIGNTYLKLNHKIEQKLHLYELNYITWNKFDVWQSITQIKHTITRQFIFHGKQ